METIYLVMTNLNIEFKNMENEFSGWNENPVPLYGFKTIVQALKEIEKLRQEEALEYKEWFEKNEKPIFIHHHYTLKEIPVFEKTLPF